MSRPLTAGERFTVLAESGFRCMYCGLAAPEATLHVDHIVPRTAGGTNDRANLVAACSSCNLGKRARGVAPPLTPEPPPPPVVPEQTWVMKRPRRDANALKAASDALTAALRELVAALADEATPPEEALSVSQAAERLGISRTLFLELVSRGRIATMKVGRRRVVPSSSISAFLKGPGDA